MKIYLSILACLLFSCSNSEKKNPHNIITETEFKTILKELHLAEASFEINKTTNMENAKIELTTAYFNIYKKNQTSKNDFNKALNYYSENPKKMEKIYTDILGALSIEKSKLDQQ
tara:strand:- start:469 stop:813 length:345 start_codon:yes stop_codon:yes gene_type:complete